MQRIGDLFAWDFQLTSVFDGCGTRLLEFFFFPIGFWVSFTKFLVWILGDDGKQGWVLSVGLLSAFFH